MTTGATIAAADPQAAAKQKKSNKQHLARNKPSSKQKAPKSDRGEPDSIKYLGTTALRASHSEVRKLKREGHQPSIHGTKVWRSSFVLMNYLKQHPIPHQARVMDIGCGWGLTGIFLAKRYHAEVTGIDADASVAPYLAAQARVNSVSINFEHKKFEQIRRHEMRGLHTLVGSDVCFWDEMVQPLFQLIQRAADVGVEQILIADPGRSPFWELAALCEKRFGAEVIEVSIAKPCKTSKQVLIVRPAP